MPAQLQENPETALELSGDRIIPQPDAAWDTKVAVDGPPEEVWKWLSRIGLDSEGGAGYAMPRNVDRILPERYRSMHGGIDAVRQVEVGDELKDGPKSVARVVEVDGTGDDKTMVLDAKWPERKGGRPGIHYSWQVVVEPNDKGGTDILARTRMADLKNPKLMRRIGPASDRWAMGLLRRGLNERISGNSESSEATNRKLKRLSMTAVGIGGLAAIAAVRHSRSRRR